MKKSKKKNTEDKDKRKKKHRKKSTTENNETTHRKSKKGKNKKIFDYEEPGGISTPSKEILPEVGCVLHELARNKVIGIVYRLKKLPYDHEKLEIFLVLTNLSDKLVKELEFHIPDTDSLKIVRNVSRHPLFSVHTSIHLQ